MSIHKLTNEQIWGLFPLFIRRRGSCLLVSWIRKECEVGLEGNGEPVPQALIATIPNWK